MYSYAILPVFCVYGKMVFLKIRLQNLTISMKNLGYNPKLTFNFIEIELIL